MGGGGGWGGYNGRDEQRQNKLRTEPFSDALHRFDTKQVCRVAKYLSSGILVGLANDDIDPMTRQPSLVTLL